jgi:hypothetical protein
MLDRMQELGVIMFDRVGQLRRNTRHFLGSGSDPTDTGGVLNVESITLEDEFCGRKLSIDFLKACLDHFKGKWTICVIQPSPLEPVEGKDFEQGKIKLSIMYARLGIWYLVYNKQRIIYSLTLIVCLSQGFKQFGAKSPQLKFWVLDDQSYDGVIKPDSFVSEVHVPLKRPEPNPLHLAMQKAISELISIGAIELRLIRIVVEACMTASGSQSPNVSTAQSHMSEAVNAACLLHIVVAITITIGGGNKSNFNNIYT